MYIYLKPASSYSWLANKPVQSRYLLAQSQQWKSHNKAKMCEIHSMAKIFTITQTKLLTPKQFRHLHTIADDMKIHMAN